MMHTLTDIVSHVASTPVLLVGSDFDGTLCELAERPDGAVPNPCAIGALRRLSRTPHTHVAVVSGRGLDDLRTRLGTDARLELSGSHGAEVTGETHGSVPADRWRQRDELTARLRSIAGAHDGCIVETKPRGVAFHYRGVCDERAGAAIEAVTVLAGQYPDLTMRLGSMVVEFLVEATTKGDRLRRLRHRAGASAVMFIGDDLTDEHAFLALGPTDAAVKVGPGDTRAQFRVSGVEEVARLLALLADTREEWARARGVTPITGHSVLSDQRTLALVAPTASVVWLCLPRIDSPPMFAELLGGRGAGCFEVTPVENIGPSSQAYDGDSLILRTSWPGCTVTDYLDCGGGRAFQRAGRSDLVRVIEGTRVCRIRFAPRVDFGRVSTRLSARERGLEVEGGSDPFLLYAPGVQWRIIADGPHHTAEAEVNPGQGPILLELRAGTANDRPHLLAEAQRRQDTRRFWNTWAGTLRLPSIATEQVRRSALMLRALVYGPTGAIAAAATTSLPEHLGGQRNWDYRFCWPRDAAMAAAALVRLGNNGTAMRLLDWLGRVLDQCESPGRLRPIYTVDGRDPGPEAEISGLAGFCGSLPVRVGNAAAQQVQLDVFGPISDLIAILAEHGAPISPDHWRMTRAMVEAVEQRWREPDHGIWEFRGEREHHVHSKVMCFHTVSRAIVVHDWVTGRANPAWSRLRDRIRDDVLANGFNASMRAFVAAYGRSELDAATLSIGLTGLVDMRDARFVSTVEAINSTLRVGGTMYRYRFDDGLPGKEGGFHLCTGWLIEALARCGHVARAHVLFDDLLRSVGPTGVLSEQHDPELNIALGNTPQAYSHLALINAALTLEEVRNSAGSDRLPDSRGRNGEHP